jgi:hypothetical protein
MQNSLILQGTLQCILGVHSRSDGWPRASASSGHPKFFLPQIRMEAYPELNSWNQPAALSRGVDTN